MSKKPKPLPKGIDLRPSGLFRVRVSGFASRSFTRLEDAEAYKETLTIAKQTGKLDEDVNADLIKLRELASEHFAAVGDSLAERTFESYRQQWSNHVLTHRVADMPLRMLTPRILEDFRDDLKASGVGDASVRRTLTIVQLVLERGVVHGRIGSNPAKAIKKPSGKRKKAIKALSPAQVEAIRAQLKNGDAVLVSLLAYSGLRPAEARALTWGDVGKQSVSIDKAAEPGGEVKATKTGTTRAVRLVEPLADDLAAYKKLTKGKASGLIFPRADGTAWTDTDWKNWTKRKFKKAAKGAAVDISRPYDLRHTAASLWLHEGISAVQVARWMGHSLQTLSSTYAHVIEDLDPDDRRTAADMIRDAR